MQINRMGGRQLWMLTQLKSWLNVLKALWLKSSKIEPISNHADYPRAICIPLHSQTIIVWNPAEANSFNCLLSLSLITQVFLPFFTFWLFWQWCECQNIHETPSFCSLNTTSGVPGNRSCVQISSLIFKSFWQTYSLFLTLCDHRYSSAVSHLAFRHFFGYASMNCQAGVFIIEEIFTKLKHPHLRCTKISQFSFGEKAINPTGRLNYAKNIWSPLF